MTIKVETKKTLPKGVKGVVVLRNSDTSSQTWLPSNLKKTLENAKKSGTFKGKKGELLIVPQFGRKPEWIFFVGVGDKKNNTPEALVKSASIAVRAAQDKNVTSIAVSIPEEFKKNAGEERLGALLTEGFILGSYSYSKYKSGKKKSPVKSSTLFVTKEWKVSDVKKGIREGNIIANATNVIRDFGNAPSNDVIPERLAELASSIGKKNKQKVTILNKKQMEKEKMGGILGVTAGSVNEPRFIIIEHLKGKKSDAPLVIIGKGITFDSGGISIKPSQAMDEMRYDMSGGGAVIGVMKAIGELHLPVNVIALVPTAENVPSGSSYKPGDILTYADGTTVEVMNTDAEGRLILGDALIYARKYKPDVIIDLATLTGAIVVALGDFATAVFSNNEELKDALLDAGEQSGEKMWHMPIPDEYSERIKSKFADLRNTSSVPGGGASTAAAFLKAFVKKKTTWAHLDIAATAWKMSDTADSAVGATGVGVRTLIEYIKRI